jgi:hypothetical protein
MPSENQAKNRGRASRLEGLRSRSNLSGDPPYRLLRWYDFRCRDGRDRSPRARRQQRIRYLRGYSAGRCADGALGPDALAAEGAGDGDERPNRQRLGPLPGDVAARLSRDRGHGGATHFRMDQSGRARLSGRRSTGLIRFRTGKVQPLQHRKSGMNFLTCAPRRSRAP